MVHLHVAERHELAEHVAPRGLVELGADAEHAELLVVPAQHALVLLAAQHVDHVHGAEALPGAVDRRERLLRGDRGVPGLGRLEAVVAVAAGCGGLAEIRQQPHAPALRGLAESEQRIELGG